MRQARQLIMSINMLHEVTETADLSSASRQQGGRPLSEPPLVVRLLAVEIGANVLGVSALLPAVLLVLALVYFAPAIIAPRRDRKSSILILGLNIVAVDSRRLWRRLVGYGAIPSGAFPHVNPFVSLSNI
jgi:hypothetical protein